MFGDLHLVRNRKTNTIVRILAAKEKWVMVRCIDIIYNIYLLGDYNHFFLL